MLLFIIRVNSPRTLTPIRPQSPQGGQRSAAAQLAGVSESLSLSNNNNSNKSALSSPQIKRTSQHGMCITMWGNGNDSSRLNFIKTLKTKLVKFDPGP